ncbi:hypothetical protein RBH29_14480 [Herbivorax sp. ANBcel31]|uniref:hypothetical protein n=1 Tax=Herbivorax sp. ANBcel31 TaxID=3069754 RepID=UPI0027B3A6DE|nr:hypothetical protein [Herbivorax sp. ANBcel31]MDQ2087634.1 hypothetical protein [Herbivorax sp. ANBcel31]
MIKRKDFLSIIIVAVMLLLVWQTYKNTNNLNNQISRLQSELSGVRSQLSNEVSSIRGTVQEMRNDTRWWTPGNYEIKKFNEEETLIKLDWILNEYKTGSNVYLNYRKLDKDDFHQVEATDMGNGYFSAVFSTSVPKEPVWDIYLSKTTSDHGRNQADRHIAKVEESKEVYYSDNNLRHQYYISTEHEGTLRTGELHNIYLSSSNLGLFNPLHANVRIGENDIFINFIEIQSQVNPKYKVQEVFLEARDFNNEELKNWQLNKIDSSGKNKFQLNATDIENAKDYESLFLVVNYNDDFSSEKEVTGLEMW